MKIIFFGTSQFAVYALQKLKANGYSISAVITQPDRKSGRHLKLVAPPVKKEAARLEIPVYQVQNIAGADFIKKLKSIDADFFVVVGFGRILTRELLEVPRFCCLNIHASLLPKYRGAAPVKWAIVRGEEKTGVTIIRMNKKLDAGDIILQKEIKIKDTDIGESLDGRLAVLGAELLIEAIELIKAGKANFTKQNEKDATFAPKLTKEDGRIDWNSNTLDILNKIRGLKGWPGTYTHLDGRVLKIISAGEKAGMDFSRFKPGEVVAADEGSSLVIKTKDGVLSVSELQFEGGRRMPSKDFLRGHRIKIGTKLE